MIRWERERERERDSESESSVLWLTEDECLVLNSTLLYKYSLWHFFKNYPGYDTKRQLMVRLHFWSSGECRVLIHCNLLWGTLWPGLAVSFRVPYIEKFNYLLSIIILLVIWNYIDVCKLFVLDRNTCWMKLLALDRFGFFNGISTFVGNLSPMPSF